MRLAVFSTKPYDKEFLDSANTSYDYEITYFETRLTHYTAQIANNFEAVCVFVNDQVDRTVLHILAEGGTRLIALRCAGFNNVDLIAAKEFDIAVVRVPAYSPHAVAEHTLGLILALNRKLYRA